MAGRVVTVAQQKGGAGKTTVAAQLAIAWRVAGRRVALLDVDPQGSLAMWHARRVERVPGNHDLTFGAIKGYRAAPEIERLARNHDVVLVDSPPHAELEARVAVRAADLVLVPVQPSPMDLWATAPTLEMARREGRPVLILFNRVPPRALLVEETVRQIEALGVQVARTMLGNRVALAASLAEGLGVVETEPASRAAEEIIDLANELWRALG
jgi:chromosome partitioning protein